MALQIDFNCMHRNHVACIRFLSAFPLPTLFLRTMQTHHSGSPLSCLDIFSLLHDLVLKTNCYARNSCSSSESGKLRLTPCGTYDAAFDRSKNKNISTTVFHWDPASRRIATVEDKYVHDVNHQVDRCCFSYWIECCVGLCVCVCVCVCVCLCACVRVLRT